MHEPDIAPLARRLAEENNVDWRRLPGTGEGGRVVERDVLGYLARVMAGDEAVDPTPEPVPEGMEAWPESDVAAYGRQGGVDDEPDVRATLDDDLFLFGDPVPSGDGSSGAAAGVEDALFVEPDDLGSDETEAPGATRPDPRVDEPLPDEVDDGVWIVGDEAADETDAVAVDVAAPPPPSWSDTPEDDDAGDELRLDELPDLTEVGGGDDGRSGDEDIGRGAGGHGSFPLPDLFGREDEPAKAVPVEDVEEPVATEVAAASPEAPAGASASFDASRAAMATPGVPWVRHGQLWRRRFDDRALRQVTSDAAAALDTPPAAVVGYLLARAASRAGVAAGPVDVWRWRRSGAERTRVDLDAAVRDAVHRVAVRAPDVVAPAASLVVADLSELDVDEAVLHLDVPVLALGRSGPDGSWLSLSGDDLEGGAATGLARIAELLGAPVRLLI